MRQFCRVGQRGIDVVEAKRRIACQNLILRGALGKTVEDHRDGNSGPRCADLAAAHLWFAANELLPHCHSSSLRGVLPQRPLAAATDMGLRAGALQRELPRLALAAIPLARHFELIAAHRSLLKDLDRIATGVDGCAERYHVPGDFASHQWQISLRSGHAGCELLDSAIPNPGSGSFRVSCNAPGTGRTLAPTPFRYRAVASSHTMLE